MSTQITISSSGGGGKTATTAFVLPTSGYYMHPMLKVGASLTNTALTNNRLTLSPAIFANPFEMESFAINVSTAVADSLVRICIYDDLNGVPRNLLYQSVDLDCSTTGIKEVVTSYNFLVGVTYWIGVHAKANPSVGHVPITSTYAFSGQINQGLNQWNQNIVFGTSSPNIFNPTFANVGSVPNVSIKIA